MLPPTAAIASTWSVNPLADASALLQDLRHGAINGCDGILGGFARAGRLMMSADAIDEVDAHLGDVAADEEMAAAMTGLWATYRQRVIVVSGGFVDLDVPSVAALAVRDPNDLHLVAAAGQQPSTVILSDDKDLRSLGLAPPNWLNGARAVMTITHGDATMLVAGTGLMAALDAAAGTWRAARDGSIPAVIALGAVIGVTVYLLVDADRRQRVLHELLRGLGRMAEIEQERQAALAAIGPFIDTTGARATGPRAGSLGIGHAEYRP